MVLKLAVHTDCPSCVEGVMSNHTHDGVGGTELFETTCTRCGGSGESPVSTAHVHADDLEDLLSDIMNKCNDIFQKVSE